ncbi:hypothetical protein P7K49_026446, partial [Saguinus oedipus]
MKGEKSKTPVLPKAQAYSWQLSGDCAGGGEACDCPADVHTPEASWSRAAHLTALPQVMGS